MKWRVEWTQRYEGRGIPLGLTYYEVVEPFGRAWAVALRALKDPRRVPKSRVYLLPASEPTHRPREWARDFLEVVGGPRP